jgi:hypothetical protein
MKLVLCRQAQSDKKCRSIRFSKPTKKCRLLVKLLEINQKKCRLKNLTNCQPEISMEIEKHLLSAICAKGMHSAQKATARKRQKTAGFGNVWQYFDP